MTDIILLTTENGYKVVEPEEKGVFGAEKEAEAYRKNGWIKILSEYIPQSKTRVIILAKERD